MALTKIDDRGLKTPIDLLADEKIGFGNTTPPDLQIYHTGSTSIIEDTTSDLNLRSTNDDVIIQAADDIFLRPQGGEEGVIIRNNGQVELYYDGIGPRFQTTGNGAKVTGTGGSYALEVNHPDWNTLQLVNTNAHEYGPYLDMLHHSASPADGDEAGEIRFLANDSADAQTLFGQMRVICTDVTNTTESGQFEIFLTNNGTLEQKLTITPAGAVGIGTDDPRGSSTYQGLELSGTTGGVLTFSDEEVEKWNIYGQGGEGGIYDRTNTRYNLKWYDTGDVELPSGNLKVAQDKGIDFSAQTATSATDAAISTSGDPELLDHYEEGTWSPKVRGSTTAGTYNASNAVGRYTRIGDVVTLTIYLSYTHTGGGGYWEIYDLPFASRIGNYACGAVFIKRMNIIDTIKNNVLYVGSGSSVLAMYGTPDDAVWVRQEVDDTSGSNEQGIIGSITYKTDT